MAERSFGELDRLEVLVDAGRRAVKDEQWGPLEGPWGPSGSGGLVRTASGRSMEAAAAEGPVALAMTEEPPSGDRALGGVGAASPPGRLGSEATAGPAGTMASGMEERMELTPEGLRAAAALLEQQQAQGPPTAEEAAAFQMGQPPPGYRPPTDQMRPIPTLETPEQVSAAVTLLRLFEEGPALVREALPRTDNQQVSRARSIVIRALDDARLWMREALEQLEKAQHPLQEVPPV